jgi:phosphoglycerate dehydrogenase-like enzyme
MKAVVLLPEQAPAAGIAQLRSILDPEHFELVAPAAGIDDVTPEMLARADALLIGKGTVSDQVFEIAKKLRLIHRYASGDADLAAERAAAMKHHVHYVIAQGESAWPTAEHTLLLMLALLKNYGEQRRQMESGTWNVFDMTRTPLELRGKTVGLIGLGSVGKAVAILLRPFGCRVWYTTRGSTAEKPDPELAHLERVTLPELLSDSDIVSVHVRGPGSERPLLTAERLRSLKENAYLVNTSRGRHVDEAALVRCLLSGRLAGVALDVFESEPLSRDSPLLSLPRCILTPHAAGKTREAELRIFRTAAEKIRSFFTTDVASGARRLEPEGVAQLHDHVARR